MFKRAQFSVSLLARNHRLGLWILLLLLTALILLSPVHLSHEYRIFQSPYGFDNLPLFGALYSIWMALLLLLLFTRGSDWGKAAIVCIFALVHLGFWTIAFPGVRDATEAYSFAFSMKDIAAVNRL
mgnify:CR=1 FL=1